MEEGSLQPWQLFAMLFLGFQALCSYFRHLLFTTVFAVAFGAFAEVLSRYENFIFRIKAFNITAECQRRYLFLWSKKDDDHKR